MGPPGPVEDLLPGLIQDLRRQQKRGEGVLGHEAGEPQRRQQRRLREQQQQQQQATGQSGEDRQRHHDRHGRALIMNFYQEERLKNLYDDL